MRSKNTRMRRRMIRQLSLVAATLLITLNTSTAWVTIGSQIQGPSLSPHLSSTTKARNWRISKLYADKNSEDSPNTSIATLSRFSSIFNRAEDISEDAEDDSKKLSFFATKFGNSDVDIENFSSSTSETVTSESSLPLATAAALTLASGLFWYSSQENLGDVSTILATGSSLVGSVNEVLADPGAALERVVELTDSMGNLGIAYFGVAYCIAEILAVPAIPLTASAGYLFGPLKGTAIVLLSASIAAGVSFQIGRTLLRDYVENLLKDYPKFATIDKAIGREGFKLMLLLRLSPIFPFALSNYLYGASSINFPAFFGGTVLGFAPGTLAYVYTGYVGKALTADTGSDVYPWYVYLGGLTLFAGLLKVVADTATRVVEEIEAEESQGNVDM